MQDSGDCGTTILPLWNSWNIAAGNKHIPIGGHAITKRLSQLLSEHQGVSLNTTTELDLVRQIKESCCYIKNNSNEKKIWQLPDAKNISLTSEQYMCTEILFNPSLLGLEHKGIHEAIYDTIMKCDMDLRMELAGNILLAGGNTTFPGFAERLQREIAALCPPKMKVNIIEPNNRVMSAWIGGSILTSLSSFEQRWITKEQYEEEGNRLVKRKWFHTMYENDIPIFFG